MGPGFVFVCFLNLGFYWSRRVHEDMVLLGFRLICLMLLFTYLSRYVGGWVGIYFYFFKMV